MREWALPARDIPSACVVPPPPETLSNQGAPPPASTGSVDDFVYAVSHDLRGPLLNFQGFLARLRNAFAEIKDQTGRLDVAVPQREPLQLLLDQPVHSCLDVLQRNAGRMQQLVTGLLELSRTGREPLQLEQVSMAGLVRALIEELAPAAEKNPIQWRLHPLPDLWTDPLRLQGILRRLLSNAMTFQSPHRSLEIELGGSGAPDGVTYWIRDNGIGIKASFQARVFQPFGRVLEIDAPGLGLGLVTAAKLAAQLEGRIWVESIHGEGSTFHLFLPATVSGDQTSGSSADEMSRRLRPARGPGQVSEATQGAREDPNNVCRPY